MPFDASVSVRGLEARSEPETVKPASARSSARQHMLMPPMPEKYMEDGWV